MDKVDHTGCYARSSGMTAVVSYSPYYLDEVMVVKLDTKHYLSYFYHKLLYVKRILTYQNYYFKWGGNAGF